MRRWGFVVLMLAATNACSAFADTAEDNSTIRALATRQADAWDRHDAKAYAELFAVDCDVVNVLGKWWSGRAELERELRVAYATVFKDSALTFTDVQVRFLTPQLAVAHMRWTMTGAAPASGAAPIKQGIQTLVVQKHAGQWLIDAFQNTNAMTTGAPAAKLLASPPPSAVSRSVQ